MEQELDFDDCYWHDSTLESIYLDRRDLGNNDTVEMIIKWYDRPRSKIIFKGVCLFKAVINGGIHVSEHIDMGYIAPADDPDLTGFYQLWSGHFDHDIKILAEKVVEVDL